MTGFELQAWHILVMFFTIVLSIFKTDISNIIKFSVMIHEQKALVGKIVLLLNPSGVWTKATINEYVNEIPFIRAGGVFVTHDDTELGNPQEKISLSNWQTQRIRVAD